ncbi:HlyD family secretion protein [Salinisphaera orenii]|uniref:efflux RND transporter periplasmic adaptor subunit n=1 Tax=Salinisphaera orenii TaxID=856731 RepID=UPI000F49B29E|nr:MULTISPECIES: HlyD family secretion protein [Salinisphaera]
MAESRDVFRIVLRVVATLLLVAVAAVLAWFAWQHYVYAPWTRDARVQADVVNVAPEVSGTITEVAVRDDRYVEAGDPLFRIQPIRFENAVDEAEAALAQAEAQRRFASQNASRLERLPAGGVSTQERQQAESELVAANASVRQARARLAQAQQDLEWASVRSPVNGYVTHLQLDEGDYASEGQSVMTLVDVDSFRITAYFEETKLPRIDVGDPVRISLMARDGPLRGHVASIGHGIAVANNAPGERNLPNVDPTFQWVRLAQRVPVTIDFDRSPTDLGLSVGLSATVHVQPDRADARDAAVGEDGLIGLPAERTAPDGDGGATD